MKYDREIKMSCMVFVALFLGVASGAASGAEVRGLVRDTSTGESLANVAIQVAGLAHRTISDATGRFHLTDIPAGHHSLNAATVGYWPVTVEFDLDPGEVKGFEVLLTPETQTRVERVSVPARYESLPDAPTILSLSANELKNLGSVLIDDPLRAVQALPGVSSNDDFEARFSVRGAGFDRIGVYLDGILLHEPFHTIETIGGSGSITAINTDLIQALDLYKGAYPVRFGDRSAAILDVHRREGSRERYAFRVSASFANANGMAEGPLGKGKRCSWMAGFRKSYLQYLLPHTRDPSLALGITDGQGRLSCSIASRNNISLDLIDSHTDLDRSGTRERLGVNSLLFANHHFTFANMAWHYTPNDKVLVTHQIAWMREKFNDENPTRTPLGVGHYGEWVGASTLTWVWKSSSPLSAGINVRDVRSSGYEHIYNTAANIPRIVETYAGTGILAGAFLQQSWAFWDNRLQLTAGSRWDHGSLDGVTAFSPQASVTLRLWNSTRFQLGWGQYAQFPEISQLRSNLGNPGLLPMRATQVIGALEQGLGARTRLRVEFYDRQDRDLLYQPFFYPRLVNGRVFDPRSPLWENSVRGYGRGVEITLRRLSANRLDGWIAYAYGRTRLRDGAAGISFPSDWDQRHTVNAYGSYRVRPSVHVSLRWTYGSGFPIPGFLQREGPLYFLSEPRNELRLSPYQRLDFRVNKSWTHATWRTTLYGEVFNITNRTNYRVDSFNGYNRQTGQAFVSFNKMFPVLPSAGMMFEW